MAAGANFRDRSTPRLPVYGLDVTYSGRRYVDGWETIKPDQGSGPPSLWHVDLGHGRVNGPHILVITDAKLPGRSSSPNTMIGATGIGDAAVGAMLGAVQATFPDGPRSRLTDYYFPPWEAEDQLAGPDWQPEAVLVGGQEIIFHLRFVGHAWVAAADLGIVAVAMHGRGMRLTDFPLTPVNDILDQYTPQPIGER